MTHTPGPWKAFGKSIKDLDHGRYRVIARVDSKGRFLPGYDEANASLMALAPEMLEMLGEILEELPQAGCPIDDCKACARMKDRHDRATALIAKAKGEKR